MLVLLIAITAVAPLTLNIPMPALPGLVRALATDVETVQLTLSVYLVVLALAQLMHGALSDRFGRRGVVLAGFALTVAASLMAAAAPTIGTLIAARCLQALGASAGIVASSRVRSGTVTVGRSASLGSAAPRSSSTGRSTRSTERKRRTIQYA